MHVATAFGRKIEVEIEGAGKFDLDNFQIDLRISKGGKTKSSCEVVIYNLRDETIESIKKDKGVSIKAGYAEPDLFETVFVGVVDSVEVESGVDRKVTIKCVDNLQKLDVVPKEEKVYEKTTLQTILRDVITSVGLNLKYLGPNISIDKFTLMPNVSAIDQLKQLCADNKLVMSAEGVYVNVYPLLGHIQESYELDWDSGLLSYSASADKARIRTLFIPKLQLGMVLHVFGKSWVITSLEMRSTESEHICEVEANAAVTTP